MMKQFTTLFMILFFANFTQAQSTNYEKLWKQVEKHEKEGLTKSALGVAEQISKLATADKNTTQHIKSLLYKSKYALVLEEDAQLKIITDFKSQIANSETPTKNILENMLANLYWHYFQQNRFQFYNRTHTVNKVDAEDFRTWDLQTLFNEIDIHYQNSLKNEAILQKTPLVNYDELLQKAENSKLYRPTLFDFLNHNALDFYQTDENSITQPAYKFQIDNADFLLDAKSFSNIEITHQDSSSLQLKALNIYKDLIAYHLKDKEPYALADVDIQRLQFVKNNATFNDKEIIYLKALKKASIAYKNHQVSALYNFEIASLYHQQAQGFDAKTNADLRWKLKDAIAICDTITQNFPKSKGAEKSKILKEIILKPTLQLTAENSIPIQHNSLLLLRYSNLNSLKFKVYPLSESQLESFNKTYRQEERFAFIKKLNAIEAWSNQLKDEKDFQEHTTEVVIPKLNNGHYLIVAAPDFSNAETFAFKTIQVTNLAFVTKSDANSELFQFINRTTGQPIEGVKVTVKYRTNSNNQFQTQNFRTDKNGQFRMNNSKDRYYNVDITAVYNADTAYFKNYYSRNYYNENDDAEEISYKPFLFTDRSIYRPGQIVYFKGIATKTEHKKTTVYANQPAKVILKNTNGEILKELQLKTNDYGSVSGEFILPNDGLTGHFSLEINAGSSGYATISVEEYKRPKFETKLLPITETFKVNDSIILKGNALAYAGSTITDAKVIYRVQRKVQYPRWFYWSKPWFHSEPQEIAHGESSTDKDGNFEISFKAIPDESVNKNSLPVFNYEITVDVTDLNGETRSATTIVNVGYHALLANISIEEQLDKTKKEQQLSISTKNLNGEFAAAQGTIKIYKLQAPNEVLRPRPWPAPDYQVLSKAEFKKLFPHEAYQDQHNIETWEKGKMVYATNFDTSKSDIIKLENLKKWDSGNYIVILESKDKFGQLVKDQARTFIFNPDDKTLPDHQLFSVTTDQSTYKTGQNVIITFGSAAENVVVTVDIEKNQKIVNTFIIPLSNNKKTIAIPVTASDLGGFAIHYSFAAFNSYQSGTQTINVPYPKSELTIETKTFRDKLKPGTDETWSFNIKGPQGDKVSAELLASMYDMSLDQFEPHQWQFNPIYQPLYYSYNQRRAIKSFGSDRFYVYLPTNNLAYPHQSYDQWNWFGFYFGHGRHQLMHMLRGKVAGVRLENMVMDTAASESYAESEEIAITEQSMNPPSPPLPPDSNQESKEDPQSVAIRKNLEETAFFFPQLQTDAEGNITFSFTTPEALTKWKLQLLAHTKTMESATTTLETVTQKELMVIPNAPRFLRHGDVISISTKIANLTEKSLSGQAVLQLFDAMTGQAIDAKLGNSNNQKSFSVDAKGNTQVTWNLTIPNDVNAIQYKVIAKSGAYSDGEQNVLPVLSNRILVTETLPMWIRSNETRTFTLDKLKNNSSKTLKNHKLTLEMTSNPAWYAVQALPYLMEYPYDSNDQIFSRYYANALASHIANSNPRIKEVFDQWASQDALISNLEKNEELKNILIQETPWLRDAQSETEQKKRIALLFDMNKMANELQSAQRKLQNNQMNNGAWAWFEGGRENRFITQQIIAGFGHLKHLDVSLNSVEGASNVMIKKAISYLDAEFIQEYKDLRKYDKKVDLSKDHLSYTQLHYLYLRSFFSDIPKSKEVQTITAYYQTQIQKYWLKRSLYAKGLMALVSHRAKDSKTSDKILKSLKENSITSDELGMYWKDNKALWFWYQAPIETQALLIEAFSEIQKDVKTVDNLKIWLLKNKQTNSWKTTKATTEAIYALLLQGSNWLSTTEMVEVTLGSEKIEPFNPNSFSEETVKVEAGTGYYKTSWNGSEIKPEMANVTLSKKDDGIAWGGLYWQYFEDLDKIIPIAIGTATPLKLKKKLFLKTNTDKGEQLSEITTKTDLNVGDLVRVRIELRSDRDMEFLHMKDMRAAGFEPVNVLSSYKYQDGLGYYESTKDAATNFFFDYLPKGIYIFEYDLRVNNSGNMSNGITTIQSMYAPEFTSHSEGIRVNVE